MSMVRCKANLHYYDGKKHRQCPYCRQTVLEGAGDERRGNDATRKVGGGPQKAGNAPERRADEATRLVSASDERTQLIAGKGAVSTEESPVVGWLVVEKGPGRGTDHRISPGQNRIGRSKQMEISLGQGDSAISADAHALVIYDYQNNSFFLKHGAGKNLTYLNGKAVLEPRELSAYDRITVGETQLLFLPLCGERFSWDA
jgi:hypothetical protein